MEPVPKVLVTGFEPFGGNDTNISQRVVNRLQVHTNWSTLGQRIRFPFMLKPMC